MKRRNSILSSKEKLVEFREIFSLVDRDGGGSISSNELGELLHIVGIEATEDELEKMIKHIDADNSGEIDFEEFANVMTKRVNPKYSSSEIKQAFKLLHDISDSAKGKVHVDTIVKYITSYGTESEKLSEERARELVMQMEVDHQGYINYEEYVDMMMHW